jgi:hypothetical protein
MLAEWRRRVSPRVTIGVLAVLLLAAVIIAERGRSRGATAEALSPFRPVPAALVGGEFEGQGFARPVVERPVVLQTAEPAHGERSPTQGSVPP